jgi:hypothetical protein
MTGLQCRTPLLAVVRAAGALLPWHRSHGQALRPIPRWTVISAGLAPLVLTVGWLVAGRLQPPAYNPIRQTMSVMAGQGGTDRWVMTAALLGVGCCYLVTAVGVNGVRMAARVMLGIAGLCSFGIAASPEPLTGPTPLHLVFTGIGAVVIAIWPAVVGWGGPRQPALLGVPACAIVTALFAAMLGWVLIETQGGSDLGLAERLMSSVQTCWPFVVALLLRWTGRDRRQDPAGPPSRTEISPYSAARPPHR